MTTKTSKPKSSKTTAAKPRASKPAAARKTAKPAATAVGLPNRKAVAKRPAPAKVPAKPAATTPAKAAARKPAARPAAKPKAPSLAEIAVRALEDLKAHNIKVIDVRKLTDVADTMIIATGTSNRHVQSLATRVVDRIEEAGYRALGIEGQSEGEWVLVDLQDVLVHVMQPRIREFYGLEKLWESRGTRDHSAA